MLLTGPSYSIYVLPWPCPLPFITVANTVRSNGFKDNTTDLMKKHKFNRVQVEPMIVKDDEDAATRTTTRRKRRKTGRAADGGGAPRRSAFWRCSASTAQAPLAESTTSSGPPPTSSGRHCVGSSAAAADAAQEVQVRAYVVRGKNIRPIDPNGLCDPYIKANLAGTSKSYGARKDHVKETLAPWFYKTITFTTELPGPGRLRLEVYDWDKRGGDDLVGRNVIDLEDDVQRGVERGVPEAAAPRASAADEPRRGGQPGQRRGDSGDVRRRRRPAAGAARSCERLRRAQGVTVFKARNMVCKDAGQNDLFFKIGVVGRGLKQTQDIGETQTTDTHFFATDGKGSFRIA